MSDEVTRLLRSIDPLHEQDLAAVLERDAARGGAQRIVSTRWPRPCRARRRALTAVSAGAVVAAGAMVAAFSLSPSSTPSAEALSFSQRGDYVIARIVNPFASVAELKRELAANHLHVALKLVPASPGSVGKVVMIDVNGTPSSGIQPLLEGKCANGPCTVGVKVARDYKGTGYVVIARPARPGERYESTPIGGAFAPGESLHCSGLSGASLTRALKVLHEKGLTVVRWRAASGGGGSPASSTLRTLIAQLTKATTRRSARLNELLKAGRVLTRTTARRSARLNELVKVSRIWLVSQINPVAKGKVEVWASRLAKPAGGVPAILRRDGNECR